MDTGLSPHSCVLQNRVLVVIPVLNGESEITRTLESVAALGSRENIHLHIQDGGSSDATVSICREFLHSLPISSSLCTEADTGMYDAIDRAIRYFDVPREQWLTWINAGDTLDPSALKVLETISNSSYRSQIDWVTGAIDAKLFDSVRLRKDIPTPLALIRAGLADDDTLPFLQQEGTFLRYRLYCRVRREKFIAHRAAGDYFLWVDLAHHARGLAYARHPLATWHQCEGQLSARLRDVYSDEMERCRPVVIRRELRESLLGLKHDLFVVGDGRVERQQFTLTQSSEGFQMTNMA
ncbi:MAG: glycosyltransferase [Pseudomonadota bacterium]